MKKILLLLPLMVASCASPYTSEMYGYFDSRNKTMSVPAGMDGPKRQIKSALRNNGWQLYVAGEGATIEQRGNVRSVYADTSAKYRMMIDYTQTTKDLILPDAFYFNLSIIENKTGQEIMAAQGKYADLDTFVNSLLVDINSHTM